ncbi:MAG: ECF-type sigma factor [Pseudomonadota bacterium]
MAEPAADITALLSRYGDGETAALGELMPLVYGELKKIASRQLRGVGGDALNTTGLVNELYLKIASQDPLAANNRSHFYAIAARAMRNLLVDRLRARRAAKRGAGEAPLPLDEDLVGTPDLSEFWLRVDRALTSMQEKDPRLVQLLECRVFGGYSFQETADVLDVSLRTVERDWMRAKAWLRASVNQDAG